MQHGRSVEKNDAAADAAGMLELNPIFLRVCRSPTKCRCSPLFRARFSSLDFPLQTINTATLAGPRYLSNCRCSTDGEYPTNLFTGNESPNPLS